MADEMRMALETLLRKADVEGDVDFLREGARVCSEALMELEVTRHIGAERHERTAERTGQRSRTECLAGQVCRPNVFADQGDGEQPAEPDRSNRDYQRIEKFVASTSNLLASCQL